MTESLEPHGFVLWAGQLGRTTVCFVIYRGGYLSIDVNPGLEAIFLELFLAKLQLQILSLSRLDVLCPEALSPAHVRSRWGFVLYATL